VACVCIAIVSIIGILARDVRTMGQSALYPLVDDKRETGFQVSSQTCPQTIQTTIQTPKYLDPLNYLNGPPTDRFRDNLRPDMKYITSWLSAGWTNDVITYMNLIYLGLLTNHIPIIPMFTPSHIGGHVSPIDFGEVFDLARFQESLQKPVLEWHQVKSRNSSTLDELGCWNTWEAVQDREAIPRRSSVPGRLKLDISYTKAPTWIKMIPKFQHDQSSSFSSLATLAFPEIRAEVAGEPRESEQKGVKLPPDEQLLCYDYLYYACSHQPYEFEFDFSPVWLHVGQFMRWTHRLENLADQYVRQTLGVEDSYMTPPWITIHIRHTDFADWCGTVPIPDCYAPIPVIARRVEEVKQELLTRKGLAVNHVIVTSDEKNATWWDDIGAQGWYRVDHSKTAEIHGPWYPVLVDAVIQSGCMGFVGTDRSTMSILARRRVQSWHGGAVRTLKWGRPNSDDH